MFERLTERARCALFFARDETSQLGLTCIETEHLLLGHGETYELPLGTVRKAA